MDGGRKIKEDEVIKFDRYWVKNAVLSRQSLLKSFQVKFASQILPSQIGSNMNKLDFRGIRQDTERSDFRLFKRGERVQLRLSVGERICVSLKQVLEC
jgi:hypothetical protein